MFRKLVFWIYLIACVVVSTVFPLGLGSGDVPEVNQEVAYFRFDYPPDPATFVFALSDPYKIQQARDILAGEAEPLHVAGEIIKSPVPYNLPWSYHLDPASISFFSQAIEVCDAAIQEVENRLDEACSSFLPGCQWCPWGSRLLEEVTAPLDFIQYFPLMFNE
jgi:hypothetical protein